MAKRAEAGYYNEFFGPLDTPITTLIDDLQKAGTTTALIQRVVDGEFDASKEESDEWAKSPEGQNTFRRFKGT
jgi:hypothetical protein